MSKSAQLFQLPLRESFCDGQIVCRFLKALHTDNVLILAIPGGPGLTSCYLDPFMLELSRRTGANVAVMDLPNHGESIARSVNGPLRYPDCLRLVSRAVEEIQEKVESLCVFGQSLGARMAFDTLVELKLPPSATLLTGFPYTLQVSSRFIAMLDKLPLQSEEGPDAERIHRENWKKILPIYTAKPLEEAEFNALSDCESVPNADAMLQGAEEMESLAKKIPNTASILVVETLKDFVVPDHNWEVLRRLLPQAEFFSIENIGHFPMVEDPEIILDAFCSFIAKRVSR